MSNNTDMSKLVAQLNEKQKQISQQIYFGNEQMRGLAKRVWRVQEDERKHIARELHDGVGQLLTALINQLQQVQKGDPNIALSESIELARQALSDTRVISRLMRPRILDDLGLIPALEWLVRIMGESEETKIEFHHQVNTDIDSDTQTLAFRVIQEALTNAIKHAQAKTIVLNVIATSKLLMIKIKDDGVGMAAGTAENPDGFGLGAMRDRVSAFGGQLTINSLPGQGCEIKVLVTGRDAS
ncbi:MAG: two-component system NarL family sensor kinase [Glaciecola sp.]|jgi:two-component system NarL family sensor kinase